MAMQLYLRPAAPAVLVRLSLQPHRPVPRRRSRPSIASQPSAAPRTTKQREGLTAVVVGGSVAGMAAAHALSGLFDKVLVVDKDELSTDVLPDPLQAARRRPGVAQFGQFHVLLAGGMRAIEGALPGFAAALEEAGGEPVTFLRDWQLISCARCQQRVPFWMHRDVDLPSPKGVQLRDGQQLGADLVVDASGRASLAYKAMGQLGWPLPPVTMIDPNLAYATRLYHRPPGWEGPKLMFVLNHTPVGGGQVLVAGYGGDHPGDGEEGFLAFARR